MRYGQWLLLQLLLLLELQLLLLLLDDLTQLRDLLLHLRDLLGVHGCVWIGARGPETKCDRRVQSSCRVRCARVGV